VIEEDGVFYVLYAQEKLAPETKQLSEAKGKVVSDYQDMLEKEWLQELNDKYEVDINRSVSSSLVDEF
jgi:peptidyl-prolyl cis-trans isomerase SurA